jgi:predicted acylesterase/phospholipase RssA
LVLAGWRKRACSHWSFKKVIEEAGIKIDYIEWSSMGAIIGGLAVGYTANQLDSIFMRSTLIF